MKRLIKYAVLLFTIVFVIAFLIVVIYPYMLKESGIQSKAKDKVKRLPIISNEYTIKDYNFPNNRSRNFIYPANTSKDPFNRTSTSVTVNSPQPTVSSADNTLVALTGVIWGKSPVAIIKDLTNNKTYVAKVGQEIGTTKILEIRQRSVMIRKGSETSELMIWTSKPDM